ncbi:hypothetical protein A4R43_41035 [Amycolatopsis albispora]|uniref:Uncharacterized protein n=1 Tax=Amycolatopsis albispora TaxID=1804986 RepID=A0A344LMC0_9PSEU|nr:hypothetical protein A4R43_41035 [Amycolatopsis albispora]
MPRVGQPAPRPSGPPGSSGPSGSLFRGPVFQGVGLVLVALVSGLVWWLIRYEAEPEVQAQPDPLVSGEFKYERVAGPATSADCAGNSYGEIKRWFGEHPCQRVVRALYVTNAGEGARALVSVVLVTMPDPELAAQLKAVTDTDNTGNISDLLRDGTANLPKAPDVAKGNYESKVSGAEVTIVEGDFYDKHKNDQLLKRITTDALRLSDALRPGT